MYLLNYKTDFFPFQTILKIKGLNLGLFLKEKPNKS